VELEGGAVVRLTASFYVGRPVARPGLMEFHGDDASLALGSFQDFDASVELGPFGGEYRPVPLVRPAPPRTSWARGVAELAESIQEDRPHRPSGEQAAHVVEILDAASASMRAGGQPMDVTSTFVAPPLLPWAEQTGA
jgi:predicted dehydrogenase